MAAARAEDVFSTDTTRPIQQGDIQQGDIFVPTGIAQVPAASDDYSPPA